MSTRRVALLTVVVASALLFAALWNDDEVRLRPPAQLATATTLAPTTTSIDETTSTSVAFDLASTTQPSRTPLTTSRRPALVSRQAITTRAPATTTPPTTAPPFAVSAQSGSNSLRQQSPSASCPNGTTSVWATVRGGTPPVRRVRLHWTAPGSRGSRDLSGSGSQWSGSLGPYYQQGTVTWWVTAVDSAGTSARSSSHTITVEPCQ